MHPGQSGEAGRAGLLAESPWCNWMRRSSGGFIDDLVAGGLLNPECTKIFWVGEDDAEVSVPATADHVVPAADTGRLLGPHSHQTEILRAVASGANYVLITGTGSDESLAYLIPVVDHVLRHRLGGGFRD